MRQWLQRLSIPDKTQLALQPLKNQLQKNTPLPDFMKDSISSF